MAQPTRYTRKYNATTFGANNPGTPQPGSSLDAEFNAVKVTLDETLDNLAMIQRDDGALKNGIVTADSLAAGLTLGYNSRGQWLTATAYAVDDTAFDAGVIYRCLEAHTSGTLATDVAAGKWVVFVDFTLDLGYTPENAANKDQPDGYAGLDSDGLLDVGISPKRTLPRYRALSTTGGTSILTDDQMDNRVIVVSGTLASNAVLQVTDVERQWFVRNNTSGAYTLTVKTAAGTGVAVTQGEWFNLYCDGTDVYQIGAAGLGDLAFLDTVDTGQIDDDAITTAKVLDANITNAKLASMAQATIKGRASGAGTGVPTDLSAAQVAAIVSPELNLFAAGMVMPYAGTSAPSGWLFAYGQAVSRTTYASLFSAISTTYGAGDGSTTFNLPDLRGRVVAGKDDMGGSSANRLTDQSGGLNGDTLGDTGGSETHTLTVDELASHRHDLDYKSGSSGAATKPLTDAANNTLSFLQTQDAGGDQPHNNVQPTIILNYIIKI